MSTPLPSSDFRSLPARPNLEFEKKRAKKLVKERGGVIGLAEAQLQIAREYGFSSWRKLASYYNTWQMHDRAGAELTPQARIDLERSVKQLLEEFSARHVMDPQPLDAMGTGAALSAYIPRFYGLSDTEIFASTLSEAEAQLVVARRSRFPDWKAANDFAEALPDIGNRVQLPNSATMVAAKKAVLERNHDELERVLTYARINVQDYLNTSLLGAVIPKMTVPEVEALLELGADPKWTPRNGFTVLEHAIIRYGNGDAVDVIAKRVTAKKSFWVAAGLGDVKTMLQFISKQGVPTEAARQDRPDAGILGTGGTVRPDASDLEVVWEAFMMAALNGRLNTMQALFDRGFPVNYTPVWYNALHVSVSYRLVAVVAFLLEHGADPDFRAWPDQQSPRDLSRMQQQHLSTDVLAQQVHALILNNGKN
ncbi:MAG: ankyrin repeat domain-containing protein [Gemmatimonas sp.]